MCLNLVLGSISKISQICKAALFMIINNYVKQIIATDKQYLCYKYLHNLCEEKKTTHI